MRNKTKQRDIEWFEMYPFFIKIQQDKGRDYCKNAEELKRQIQTKEKCAK
jgi:hypothetical protein